MNKSNKFDLSSFGENNLTDDEINIFHISPLRVSYEESVKEYEKCSDSRLGRLIANRELPILKQAKVIWDSIQAKNN